MKITHLSSEFSPVAKAGGLGDVLVGLGRELTKIGHETEIIIPKYNFLNIEDFELDPLLFFCEEKGILHKNRMWKGTVQGCRLLLLETDHPNEYFNRGTIYGCDDDLARFLYFSKAAIEYIKAKGDPIVLLHLHDWHTAIAAVLLKDSYALPIKKTLLTIHNGEHQGKGASWDLDAIGLDTSSPLRKKNLQDMTQKETINLLKGGIFYSDIINTVSPTYAKELLDPCITGPLAEVFKANKHKFFGILNGIDQTIWDPGRDSCLKMPFQKTDPIETILIGKEEARNQIRAEFGIEGTGYPWIGSITRLVPQKSPDLIESGLEETIQNGGSFLLLGSSPISEIQTHYNQLKKKYEKNKNVLFFFEYNEVLSHQLYAAFDFFLMPSRFEPCGLAQLISMRYGALPIVRKTGGLQDTVHHLENGIVFEKESTEEARKAVKCAIDLYKNDQKKRRAMIQHAMNLDFGWKKSAEKYLDLYKS